MEEQRGRQAQSLIWKGILHAGWSEIDRCIPLVLAQLLRHLLPLMECPRSTIMSVVVGSRDRIQEEKGARQSEESTGRGAVHWVGAAEALLCCPSKRCSSLDGEHYATLGLGSNTMWAPAQSPLP